MKTSLDLHLAHSPGEVVRTDEISDVGCGMYPCYYVQQDSELWVSTSAVSLIGEMGSLERNPEFDIPDYLKSITGKGSESDTIINEFIAKLPSDLTSHVPSEVGEILRQMRLLSSPSSTWYDSWNTIDTRIFRVRPFETVTPNSTERLFEPTYTLDDPDKLVRKTAKYMKKFVHRIEREYPDREHIIHTGGKDSLLITLVPKKTDNWHIFSAEPNYPLVEEFVERNNIDIKRMIRDDNKNRESTKDLQKKLLSSDLLMDPRHCRWVKKLKELTEEMDSDCIFWNGDGGGELLQHRPDLEYPKTHLTRVPSKQGMYHQTVLNFTQTPLLTPYHSPKIWDDVFAHYEPSMMSDGMDVRPQIGEIFCGNDIWWPDRNPTPDAYQYNLNVSAVELFLSGLYEDVGIEKINYPN